MQENHLRQPIANQGVQRPAEIRKCRIAADGRLHVNGKTFRQKAIAVGKKDMNQLVHDRGIARVDAPGRKFHPPALAGPRWHERF